MKNSFRILVLILLAVWVGFSLFRNREYKDLVVSRAERKLPAVPVKTLVAEPRSITTTVTVSGKVEGTNEVFIVSTVSGEVGKILVQPGSTVTKGQLLATIDSYYLQEQYDLANAAYEQDLKDYERLRSMAEVNAVTGQQLEQYALKVASSETQMKLARRRLQDSQVRASVSGTVNQVFTSEGATLAPGRPICEIVGGPFNMVKTGVQERYRPYLLVGTPVQLKDFQRIHPTSASIAAIGVKPNQLGKVPVEITFDPIEQLYAGKLVDVALRITTDTALFLPQEAILSRDGNNFVMVNERGTAASKTVITGEQVKSVVRIKGGLPDGSEVIIEGNTLLHDGDSVMVVSQ